MQANTVILPILRIMRDKKKMDPEHVEDDPKGSKSSNSNDEEKEVVLQEHTDQNGAKPADSGSDDNEEHKENDSIDPPQPSSPSRSGMGSEYCFEDSLDLDAAQTITSLVPQTPASLEANEYTKLLRNTLNFNKNVVITSNFHSFASKLIVADQIQQDFARQNGDMELIVTPNHSPQKNVDHLKVNSLNSGDDAFLASTVHHDFVQKASVPAMRDDSKWIDVWLFASDYTLNLSNIQNNNRDDTFPMLMVCHLLQLLFDGDCI